MGREPMTDAERRAIEAELPSVIERLKRGATRGGVISQRAFALETDRLGLTTDEQRRGLRTGLVAVGLRVKASPRGRANHRPTPASDLTTRAKAPSAKAAALPPVAAAPGPVATEAAARLAQARRMLARYAAADGTVSKLAHDGVVRLHRLSLAEARELTADFPIARPRPHGTPAEPAVPGEARPMGRDPAPAAASARPPHTTKRTRSAAVAPHDTLSDAVRAARAVLEADRWRRNPARVTLRAEEEVGLAVLLRGSADHLSRDVPKEEIAALSPDDERRRAHDCLVLHNRRLVWKIAQYHQGRGLDTDDLVQHGTIGLLRAVRRFDATKGYKFSTYATWWIKQAITRAIADEGTLIRLPVHLHEKVAKVAKAERKLLSEGRPRTVDNVAYVSGLTFAEVERIRRISRPTDSLDRVIGDDTALGDLVIGPSRLPGPAAVLIRKEFQARVRHVLEHLSERERHVLVRRTGLDGDEPDTLEDIGAVFGVTRERIRQIEGKARAKFHGQLARHGLKPPAA